MQHRVPQHPHPERPVDIEIVDAKQLDAGLDRREQSTLDLNSLRGQGVEHGSALHPVDQIANAECDDGHRPLPKRRDRCWMAFKELPFDFSGSRLLVLDEVRIAETAFDGRSFNRLAAHGARLGVSIGLGLVAHIASATTTNHQPRTTNHERPTTNHEPEATTQHSRTRLATARLREVSMAKYGRG